MRWNTWLVLQCFDTVNKDAWNYDVPIETKRPTKPKLDCGIVLALKRDDIDGRKHSLCRSRGRV